MKRLAEEPLPFRELYDLGYLEFACSVATFEWLQAGGMTSVNGQPVTLYVADRMPGGHNLIVQVRSTALEAYQPETYAWQKAA